MNAVIAAINSFVTLFSLLVKSLPVLIEAVKSVEALHQDQPGAGESKLALVRVTLETAYDAIDDLEEPFEKLWPAFNSLTTAVVGVFNKAGTFQKSTVETDTGS